MSNHSNDNRPKKSRPWLSRLASLIRRQPQNTKQLMTILRYAEERRVLSADVVAMFERILQVSDMQVREVMIPHAQMVVIKKDQTLDSILPIVTESGHSRFPVVDGSGKDVIGMLLAKDLLKYCFNYTDTKTFHLGKMLRPAIFTPQSKRLDILLREFRITRNHIAIVLDEYGSVAGLVTIEDVLEQIVGEIEDEYDIDEENGHIKKLNDGAYIVKASTLIEEFNKYFDTDFSDEEFDTIGGIVLKGFGHMPTRGEKIKIQDFQFKVLHSDKRRLYLLELKKPIKKKNQT